MRNRKLNENYDAQELGRLENALIDFYNGWVRCNKVFYEMDDVNDFITDNYPFDCAFEDLNMRTWLESCIDKIEDALNAK